MVSPHIYSYRSVFSTKPSLLLLTCTAFFPFSLTQFCPGLILFFNLLLFFIWISRLFSLSPLLLSLRCRMLWAMSCHGSILSLSSSSALFSFSISFWGCWAGKSSICWMCVVSDNSSVWSWLLIMYQDSFLFCGITEDKT